MQNTRTSLWVMSVLLMLCAVLLVAQNLADNIVLWILTILMMLTTIVFGVVLAALKTQAHGRAADSDAAKLDELEPLPPATDEPDRP